MNWGTCGYDLLEDQEDENELLKVVHDPINARIVQLLMHSLNLPLPLHLANLLIQFMVVFAETLTHRTKFGL